MKRWGTGITAILLILLLPLPAIGAVNVNVNGLTYASIEKAQLVDGCAMVTPNMVEKIAGADIAVSGNRISIKNNQDRLEMTLDSKLAILNGKAITLATPPKFVDTALMLPARTIFQTLGAKVGWLADHSTLTIDYGEENQGLDASEILDKMQVSLAGCKSYKIRISHDDDSYNPEITGRSKTYNVHVDTDIANQTRPFLFYCKTIGHRTDENQLVSESQAVGNESGMFLKFDNEPWNKINDRGVISAGLIHVAGSEDPIYCLQELRKAGAILSLGNDIRENDHNYWVIEATMSQEALPDINFYAMGCNMLFGCPREYTDTFQNLLKMIQGEMSFTIMVDQETSLPSSIKFESMMTCIEPNMAGGNQSGADISSATSVSIYKYNGSCQFYGFGESFTVPDVSSAIPGEMPTG